MLLTASCLNGEFPFNALTQTLTHRVRETRLLLDNRPTATDCILAESARLVLTCVNQNPTRRSVVTAVQACLFII